MCVFRQRTKSKSKVKETREGERWREKGEEGKEGERESKGKEAKDRVKR